MLLCKGTNLQQYVVFFVEAGCEWEVLSGQGIGYLSPCTRGLKTLHGG